MLLPIEKRHPRLLRMNDSNLPRSGMRVLQLLSSGGIYGAEKMVVSLAKGLDRMGCHSILGVLDNMHVGSADVITYMQQQNLPVAVIPCKGKIDGSLVDKIRQHIRSYEI